MALSIRTIETGKFTGLDYSMQVLFTDIGKKFDSVSLCWLILGGSDPVIVDTGMDLETGPLYGLNSPDDPREMLLTGLKESGVRPEDIKWIIHTHLHVDHVSNDDLFPNAKMVIRRRELEVAAAPVYPLYYHRPQIGKFVNEYWDRLVLIDEDREFLPGLRLVFTGGHTVGHQAIYVKTEAGTVAIAGDILNLYANLETRSPNVVNVPEVVLATERFKREADIIIPAHDPEVIRRYGRWIPQRG